VEFLEANLTILARRQPELAQALRAAALKHIEWRTAKKGLPTCFYHRPPHDPVPLHSRYDPLQEARRSLAELDLSGADYFIFLGFGLGYGLDALFESADRDRAHVFVVEADLEILRAAFQARDLARLLSLAHLHFAWPPAGSALALQWEHFFDPVNARKSVFIPHAPSLVIDPPLFREAAELIRSRTLRTFTDINTLVGKSELFLANLTANFARAAAAPGVAAFARRFEGVPAVVIAAGPSLDRNLHELPALRERALLLAADTALKPLLAAGVEPHFVMTGDPGFENYLHLQGAGAHDTLLVAEATAHPEALAEFDGRTVICTFESSSLASLSGLMSSKGTLRAWGSVATMGLDYALLLGCDPIIFVGQDLAFSGGRTYCSGIHPEREWFKDVFTPEQWLRRWEVLRASYKIVMTEDIFRRPVPSTDKLLSYWNWMIAEIEKRPEVRFINATGGGILRGRLEVMSLPEVRQRCCRRVRNLRGEIALLFAEALRTQLPLDLSVLDRLRAEHGRLSALLESGLALCAGPGSRASRGGLMSRLHEAHQSVLRLRYLSPLLDSCNQMGNVSFLRRRTALPASPDTESGFRELLDTYREYFQSLARAGAIISDALARLPQSSGSHRSD